MTKRRRQSLDSLPTMFYFINILLRQEYFVCLSHLPKHKQHSPLHIFPSTKKIGILAAPPIERVKEGFVFTSLLTALSDAFYKSVIRTLLTFFDVSEHHLSGATTKTKNDDDRDPIHEPVKLSNMCS